MEMTGGYMSTQPDNPQSESPKYRTGTYHGDSGFSASGDFPKSSEWLKHILGSCSAIEHSPCWYRENEHGLEDNELDKLQEEAILTHLKSEQRELLKELIRHKPHPEDDQRYKDGFYAMRSKIIFELNKLEGEK